MVEVVDRCFIRIDGEEFPVRELPKYESDWRIASYRASIEQILECQGEDFIKTRLKKLLEI